MAPVVSILGNLVHAGIAALTVSCAPHSGEQLGHRVELLDVLRLGHREALLPDELHMICRYKPSLLN